MPNTLTAKFTIFFWSIFFIINIGIYLFTTGYLKETLLSSEKEKIELLVKTLNPILAINLSSEQSEEVNRLLEKQHATLLKTYIQDIKDPLTSKNIAKLTLRYSNQSLLIIEHKIKMAMFTLFLFALFLFSLFYLFIKKELNLLHYISQTLEQYAQDQKLKQINIHNASKEITTITKVANTMMQKISSNITELQSFNQRLENQEKMMVHQSRQAAMGEMIESIAHQWRQPLNIIGLASSNLELENSLGIHNQQNFQEKMSIIADNINYMSNTIDDFRDFLNPDRKQQLFNPADVIEEVLKILKAQLLNNKIILTVKRDDSIEFYGVENEFKQVLFVLINNAKDAIKSQQKENLLIQGEIHIELTTINAKSTLFLCDNGGGIPKDIINSVFDPYFTTKFASSGTGIGLYIAKNIITSRMKGELHVKNTQNGCCFSITQEQQILKK